MKKRKLLLAVIAIIALIVLLATGYTFSKFYQSIKGNGTMQLAAWVFKVTTNDNKPLSQIILQGENGEAILPGSSGSFDITVDSIGSTINIAYHTVVTNENLPESMKFYMKDNSARKYQDLADLATDKLKGELTRENPTKTYTVCWEWPLEGNDLIDSSSSNSYGFNIEVIGEQK